MLGQKLAEKLADIGKVGKHEIAGVTLADAGGLPRVPGGAKMAFTSRVADITDEEITNSLIAEKPALIFHLAAVVSGEAEANFEKGYSVNVDGTRNLLESIRRVGNGYKPRVVFTSSVAVYGGPFPEIIDDNFHLQPRTSYGTQKAICELLLNDYSRRGFIDGIGLRLPTLCIRPGVPNQAASGLFSNILREPLVGLAAILPASKDVSMVFASPRSAVAFLLKAATLDTDLLGDRRSLMMPGVWATIGDEIDALRRVAGQKIVDLILEEPNVDAQKMVANWNFAPLPSERARSLGFTCEVSMDEIIRVHIEDELGGKIPGLGA